MTTSSNHTRLRVQTCESEGRVQLYTAMPVAAQSTPAREQPIPAALTFQRDANGTLQLSLSGDWLGQAAQPGLETVERQLAEGGPARALEFQAGTLGKWNSSLVGFVLRCRDYCRAQSMDFRTGTLPAGVLGLIKLAEAAPEGGAAKHQDKAQKPFLQRVGESSLIAWSGAAGMITFLGEILLALVKLVRGQAQFRWADALLVMQQCGPQALGIVALINFLVGLILAFVGAVELARFGASIYVADLVAVATVREMACIMTGIVLCGRTGAAFAAQLGTMKVNQEIDGFATFGISPMEFLVLPRVLALVAMMPLLCLFANLISIFGGFLVSSLLLNITPVLYLRRTMEAITLASLLLGVFKGSFFGVLIALTGCMRGMQCGNNAAAVGEATTRAVVTGITAIIASDGVFALICHALNL